MSELFTLVFIVLMVASGERISTVRSKEAFTWEQCNSMIQQMAPLVAQEMEQRKGFKVQLIGMCVPEERKAGDSYEPPLR